MGLILAGGDCLGFGHVCSHHDNAAHAADSTTPSQESATHFHCLGHHGLQFLETPVFTLSPSPLAIEMIIWSELYYLPDKPFRAVDYPPQLS
jgi:hypothetical protein